MSFLLVHYTHRLNSKYELMQVALFGVVYHENVNNWATASLIEAIEKKGHQAKPFRLPDVAAEIPNRFTYLADEDVTDMDGVMVRTVGFGTGDQITYRISLLEHFEDAGIYVMNPAYSFRRAKDKYATLTALNKAGIKVPRTFIGENLEAAINFAEEVGDVVIKPLIGARGLGSIRAGHTELTYRAMKFIHQLGQVIYVQEMVEKPDRDIRAFVIGGKLVGAMYRYLPEGQEDEWRTNVHGGGRAEVAELDGEYTECALKVAEVLNLDYTGVDILESPDGPCVIEANAAPSWSALSRVTNLDIAGMIIDRLVEKSRK
ncbi:MAG: RimK family alpha-L-glutamate ligase [Candidatus Thorarchaeota archaeon]|nr:RimK family alpha-L-glutamate ligase [Candidatus Thorarchaeota archaeon]